MATVRASASNTIIAMLGTINSTASTAAKTIDAAANSVDMLTSYIERAKDKQAKTYLVEDLHWERNLVLEAAKAQEKIETDLVKEYQNDQSRAARFNSIVAQLEAKLRPAEV